MKLLYIILCILFVLCLYSNNILYGAGECTVSSDIHNQNKTKFSNINNKIKEINNIYKEIKIEAHKELKNFHESNSDYSNKLNECKSRLNNKLLQFDTININNLSGGKLSECQIKTYINEFMNKLQKLNSKQYLKNKISTLKSKSIIYINNWYDDIKNNLLNGNNKVNDYDNKIQQLDEKYSKFNDSIINSNELNTIFLDDNKSTETEVIKLYTMKAQQQSNNNFRVTSNVEFDPNIIINYKSTPPYIYSKINLPQNKHSQIYINDIKFIITYTNNYKYTIIKTYQTNQFIKEQQIQNTKIYIQNNFAHILYEQHIKPFMDKLNTFRYNISRNEFGFTIICSILYNILLKHATSTTYIKINDFSPLVLYTHTFANVITDDVRRKINNYKNSYRKPFYKYINNENNTFIDILLSKLSTNYWKEHKDYADIFNVIGSQFEEIYNYNDNNNRKYLTDYEYMFTFLKQFFDLCKLVLNKFDNTDAPNKYKNLLNAFHITGINADIVADKISIWKNEQKNIDELDNIINIFNIYFTNLVQNKRNSTLAMRSPFFQDILNTQRALFLPGSGIFYYFIDLFLSVILYIYIYKSESIGSVDLDDVYFIKVNKIIEIINDIQKPIFFGKYTTEYTNYPYRTLNFIISNIDDFKYIIDNFKYTIKTTKAPITATTTTINPFSEGEYCFKFLNFDKQNSIKKELLYSYINQPVEYNSNYTIKKRDKVRTHMYGTSYNLIGTETHTDNILPLDIYNSDSLDKMKNKIVYNIDLGNTHKKRGNHITYQESNEHKPYKVKSNPISYIISEQPNKYIFDISSTDKKNVKIIKKLDDEWDSSQSMNLILKFIKDNDTSLSIYSFMNNHNETPVSKIQLQKEGKSYIYNIEKMKSDGTNEYMFLKYETQTNSLTDGAQSLYTSYMNIFNILCKRKYWTNNPSHRIESGRTINYTINDTPYFINSRNNKKIDITYNFYPHSNFTYDSTNKHFIFKLNQIELEVGKPDATAPGIANVNFNYFKENKSKNNLYILNTYDKYPSSFGLDPRWGTRKNKYMYTKSFTNENHWLPYYHEDNKVDKLKFVYSKEQLNIIIHKGFRLNQKNIITYIKDELKNVQINTCSICLDDDEYQYLFKLKYPDNIIGKDFDLGQQLTVEANGRSYYEPTTAKNHPILKNIIDTDFNSYIRQNQEITYSDNRGLQGWDYKDHDWWMASFFKAFLIPVELYEIKKK